MFCEEFAHLIAGALFSVGSATKLVHVHRTLVAAVLAGHEQPTDPMLAHAAERHRADRFVVPSHATS
jgi:hypothetical protein